MKLNHNITLNENRKDLDVFSNYVRRSPQTFKLFIMLSKVSSVFIHMSIITLCWPQKLKTLFQEVAENHNCSIKSKRHCKISTKNSSWHCKFNVVHFQNYGKLHSSHSYIHALVSVLSFLMVGKLFMTVSRRNMYPLGQDKNNVSNTGTLQGLYGLFIVIGKM